MHFCPLQGFLTSNGWKTSNRSSPEMARRGMLSGKVAEGVTQRDVHPAHQSGAVTDRTSIPMTFRLSVNTRSPNRQNQWGRYVQHAHPQVFMMALTRRPPEVVLTTLWPD